MGGEEGEKLRLPDVEAKLTLAVKPDGVVVQFPDDRSPRKADPSEQIT